MLTVKINAMHILALSLALNIGLTTFGVRQYNRAERNSSAVTTLTNDITPKLDSLRVNLRIPSKMMALLPAVIQRESKYQNIPGDGGRSHGIGQVQLATAKGVMKLRNLTVEDLYNPKINAFLAVEYLDLLYRQYDSVRLALSAYNGGLRVEHGKVIAMTNEESYVNPIMKYRKF